MTARALLACGAASLLLAAHGEALAQDATAPGAASAPYPTFQSLSLEWLVAGDDDGDGQVTVRYRPAGATSWREGLPLFRVPAGANEGHSWANRHAGSLFGLEAGTSYEVELTLTDPDGGDAVETIDAATRAWPVDLGPIGTSVDPATIGAALAAAGPGDVLVLADGNYGAIQIGASGTEELPIVIRAENPGGAIVDGDVRVDGQAHVQVIDLTVNGQIKFNDATRIVVRGCTINAVADGIVSYGDGVEGALIVDNVVTGPTVWSEAAFGVNGDNLGEGIVLTGPGNVIAFNRVVGFRDCISLLEDSVAVNQQSIDIYGNDLDGCADDGIEADFAMGNVRVHHNRITNAFMAISSQPSLGGPTYFLRNVIYNAVLSAFKLQRSSVGDVGLHNTVVKAGDAFGVFTTDVWSRAWFRNNLFFGGPGGTYGGYDIGSGRVMYLPTADDTCHFDYDGFGSIGTGTFTGNVGGTTFDGLAELLANTTEAHAVEIDLSVFAEDVAIPDPSTAHAPPSLALAPDGDAVDRGLALAGVNDGYAGGAPDLGAYEIGQRLPVYGPGGTLAGSGGSGGGSGGNDASGGGDAGGNGAGGGSGGGAPSGADDTAEGCGCRLAPQSGAGGWLLFLAAAALRSRRVVRS